MYSPQRNNRAPFDRFSPHNKSPNEYRIAKKTYEGLTLEEFLAAKKTTSPIRSSNTTTRSSPNRIHTSTVHNRLAVTKSSPVRASTVRTRVNSSINRSPTYKRTTNTSPTTTTTTSNVSRQPDRPVINFKRTPITPSTRHTVVSNRRPTVYNTKQPQLDKQAIHSTTFPVKPKITTEQKIQVCIRKRPLNRTEIANHEQDIAPLSGSRTIEILAPKQKVDLTKYTEQHAFTFDEVFDNSVSNKMIYQRTTRPLVDHMFQGGKATCFAYGQTGSGKTYTMLDAKHGLYVQATFDIFRFLNQAKYAHLQAWVGYYEIYQGQLFDLLNDRQQLIPREDGKGNVHIAGLKEFRIHSSDTMMEVFHYGNRERSTCKTNANEASSRSHAILQILLKSKNQVHGKLNFIDLAGSERGTDRGHQSDAKIRLEGAEINRSLLALKECIRALDKDKKHAPFRGSKLTMVLKDSFVGNSKTCMIATISPNHSNSDHTLNTLRYADRVKELRGESDPRLQQQQTVVEEDVMMEEDEEDEEEEENVPRKITQGHIKEFLHWHQVQVECNQQYVQESQQLLQNVSQQMHNNNGLLQEKYKLYTQNLEDLMNRKACLIQKLRDRIEMELE